MDLGEGVEESEGAIFVPEFAYVLPNEILRKCYQIDHDLGKVRLGKVMFAYLLPIKILRKCYHIYQG